MAEGSTIERTRALVGVPYRTGEASAPSLEAALRGCELEPTELRSNARCGASDISRWPQAMARKHGRRTLTMYQRLERGVDHCGVGIRVGLLGDVVRQAERTRKLVYDH